MYTRNGILYDDNRQQWKIIKSLPSGFLCKRNNVEKFFSYYKILNNNISSVSQEVSSSKTGSGVSDHGSLTGLGDNDHTQYPLKTNVLELDNVTAFIPNADYEPATKKYVDDEIGSIPVFTPRGQALYVQTTEPTDAEENDIWINIS